MTSKSKDGPFRTVDRRKFDKDGNPKPGVDDKGKVKNLSEFKKAQEKAKSKELGERQQLSNFIANAIETGIEAYMKPIIRNLLDLIKYENGETRKMLASTNVGALNAQAGTIVMMRIAVEQGVSYDTILQYYQEFARMDNVNDEEQIRRFIHGLPVEQEEQDAEDAEDPDRPAEGGEPEGEHATSDTQERTEVQPAVQEHDGGQDVSGSEGA
jgi:hypothetical protein